MSQRHQKYSQRCPSPLVAVRPFTTFVVSTEQPTHVCAVRLRGLARHLLARIEHRVWFPFRSELCSIAGVVSSFERLYNGCRNRKVVQRPKGIRLYPARRWFEGRVRAHFGRRTVGDWQSPRGPKTQLRGGARPARQDVCRCTSSAIGRYGVRRRPYRGAASSTVLRGYDGNPPICGWPGG